MVEVRRRDVVGMLGLAAIGVGLTGCAEPSAQAAAKTVAPVVGGASPTSVSLRGGTRVTVRGAGLAAVTTVRVAGTDVAVESATADRVVFLAPASVDFVDRTGTATLRSASRTVGTVALTWSPADGIDRQLQYLLRYWKHYNPAYEAIADDDCVDFTSQSLLARGWTQQGTWTHAADVADSGAAWISSTAFRDFMTAHPALGTALTDEQRAKVRLGDVVQFDWDDSGDRDHTGVVTRITKDGDRIRIGFAGHTRNSDYRDVDHAITVDHPGGVAYYWSLT